MTIGEVTGAAELPEDEAAAALLALPESQWYDRKSARIQPRKLAETLVAMGNAEGGTVVVGLSNGRTEHVDDERANSLRQSAVDFTQPPVRIRTDETWSREGSERRRLLVIRVLPGESLHEMSNGDCYLRIGDETRLLSHLQRQELFYDRSDSSYDSSIPSRISLDELDSTAVEEFRSAVRAEADAAHLLRSRGLINRDGRATVAATLLFHPTPQVTFPNAHVRVLRYLSDERGSGATLSLADDGDTRIDGPLPALIDRAAQAIDAQIPRRRALGPSGKFEAIPAVPRDVWLEALVNAVVHRSYSMAGDHIRVEIFPTRIEVTSPGRFPGIVDVDNPHSITRYARNPLIARVCADLRIGQELGEGIRRMVDIMERSGLTAPVFRQSASHVVVTLSAHSMLDRATVERLPKGAIAALAVLQHAGRPLGTGEIVETLDVARPTALRRLRALEAEGMIVRDAQSPQDPRATWRLA